MSRNGFLLSLSILAFAGNPAAAVSGIVTDPEGVPISGATACLWKETNVGLCVETDATGMYRMPSTSIPAVRITAAGFLPIVVAAVHQSSPVVLRRAASLRAFVVDDATGEPVDGGRIHLTYFSGRELEGFPFNRSGVRIATLEPGTIVVRAKLDGFRDSVSEAVTLTAGQETELTLRLRRDR